MTLKHLFRPLQKGTFTKNSLCFLSAVALLLCFLGLARSSSAMSVYGMPLSKAYSKDFFQFFQFRVVGVSITDDGFMEIIFKPPKGNPTRTSVKLFVVLEKDGQIKRMRLELVRSFIDDLKQGMFARDVAKSFIQAGVHADDYVDARPVVNEIFFRQKLTPIDIGNQVKSSGSKKSGSTISIYKLGEGKLASGDIIIIGDGANIPKLPPEHSDLYKCFTGRKDSFRQNFSKSSLLLENTLIDGNKVLVMTIGPRDIAPKAELENFDFHNLPLFLP